MAPNEESYFPPLEKCLSGNFKLTTWKFVFDSLCDLRSSESVSSLAEFLSCESSTRLLTRAAQGLPAGSSSSKSSFENKTAAINVTPTSHGHYDIEKIKQDALWLSAEVDLDEIEALRIATIEWQDRPRERLQQGLSENERASMSQVLGALNTPGPLTRFQGDDQESFESFLSPESRRTRLLIIYLEEARSILGSCEKLIGIALAKDALLLPSRNCKNEITASSANGKGIEAVGRSVFEKVTVPETKDGLDLHALSCIEAMESRLDRLEQGNGWHISEAHAQVIEEGWIATILHDLVTLSDLLLLNLRSSRRICKSSLVLPWFRMVSRYEFFGSFPAQSDIQAHLGSLLQQSAATTSIALLDPAMATSYLLDSDTRIQVEQDTDENFYYFFDRNNINEIQEIFHKLGGACIAMASPAVFAWGIILYTIRELGIAAKDAREGQHVQKAIDQGAAAEHQQGRRLSSSSLGSTQQSIYEDVVDHARAASRGEDPVGFLTQSALDGCNVFDVIADIATSSPSSTSLPLIFWRAMSLLDLVRTSFESIGYTPEILTATLAVLEGCPLSPLLSQTIQAASKANLASAFMADDFLMSHMFDTSLARFPYEALPFLRFCKALARNRRSDGMSSGRIFERLQTMDSFTQVVPRGFAGYHTIREDENANLVSLEQPFNICHPPDSMLLGSATGTAEVEESYVLPSGAIGQVVSESKPIVIMWYHKYSALGFLGRWLQLYKNGQETQFMHSAEHPDTVISTIIQLISSLVVGRSTDEASGILEEYSDGLDRNTDIVLVIFEIFERQIQSLRFRNTADDVLTIVSACIEFMAATVNVLPGRIWPLLARSNFLNLSGGGSLIVTILSSNSTMGISDFLETCVHLYGSMLENAFSGIIAEGHPQKMREHNRLSISVASGAPTHMKTRLLFAFTQAMGEVYDSLSSWHSDAGLRWALVRTGITQAFRDVLKHAYGVDDNPDLTAKLTAVTSTAAPYILDSFRPDAASDTNLIPLLQILAGGVHGHDSIHQEHISHGQVEQVTNTLCFCHDLIRGARLQQNVTYLERQMCQAFPVLIRLYGMHAKYQVPCLRLMSELVAIGSVSESDSSSLLSFLGMESSRSLLEMLSTLDRPSSDTQLYMAVWDLLTALLSARQQWFAIYLLTGSSPKEKMKDPKAEVTQQHSGIRGKAFLNVALEELSHIEALDPERATAMLSFVCRAQENWSWTTNSLQSHQDFFTSIMSYVGKMDIQVEPTLNQCYKYKIAALVAELSIVYLHYARTNRDYSIMKKMIPAFHWYTDYAVENTAFNSSLHANLRKNLKARFPSRDALKFKRTTFSPSIYGEDFFYDMRTASQMLSFDSSWTGTIRSPGFEHEFKLANLNLSLVDSQLLLLQSFKALCLEHSVFFVRDREVQKLMAQVVRNCLAANSQTSPAEKIFDSLFETRMELAVGLLQRLVDIGSRGSEFTTLLGHAWEATRFRNANYDAAISNNDLHYYRLCATALLLCIQLHIEKHHPLQDAVPGQTSHNTTRALIVEILSNMVAPGVGQVSNALYDQLQTSRPLAEEGSASEVGIRDFSLLLSIIQSALRLPYAPQMIAQISSVFISSNIIDSTLRLYSWSHRLTLPNADPVYSSCALSFLVALSTLPPVAEELGIEGVLSRLATSRITLLISDIPGGVHPFEPVRGPNQYPHQQRLFTIWSEGLLPLCLNLLHSVGRPMASEVAAFLNHFPQQLDRASNAFSFNATSKDPAAGAISLSLVNEATTLALISHALSIYRIAGASAGVDSFEIPILRHFDEPENKRGLKSDVEDLLGRRASLRSRTVVVNEKESGWARTKARKMGGQAGGGGGGGEKAENVLEEKLVVELRRTLVCLKGDEEGQ